MIPFKMRNAFAHGSYDFSMRLHTLAPNSDAELYTNERPRNGPHPIFQGSATLFSRLAVDVFVVGLCFVAGVPHDAITMIRRRVKRVEL